MREGESRQDDRGREQAGRERERAGRMSEGESRQDERGREQTG